MLKASRRALTRLSPTPIANLTMALSVSLANTSIGIPLDDAYVRITVIHATKDYASMSVAIYASKEARDNGAQEMMTEKLEIPFDQLEPGDNPINIAYNWLKQQPGYLDATDC